MKPEVVHGNEKASQPRVHVRASQSPAPPPAVCIDSGMIVNAGLVTDAPAFTLLQSST
jgi:hypothetical protein